MAAKMLCDVVGPVDLCCDDPNFAVICDFLRRFGGKCGLILSQIPTISDFELWFENSGKHTHKDLISFHVKLLRKLKRSVMPEKWEMALIKFVHTYCSSDAWEIERFGYKNTKLSIKLRIIKNLLETQFDKNIKFKSEINQMSADELRGEPIGSDKLGNSYWLQIDEEASIRIYKEDLDEETWEMVANNKDDFDNLIRVLKTNSTFIKKHTITSTSPLPEEDEDSMQGLENIIRDTNEIKTSQNEFENKDDLENLSIENGTINVKKEDNTSSNETNNESQQIKLHFLTKIEQQVEESTEVMNNEKYMKQIILQIVDKIFSEDKKSKSNLDSIAVDNKINDNSHVLISNHDIVLETIDELLTNIIFTKTQIVKQTNDKHENSNKSNSIISKLMTNNLNKACDNEILEVKQKTSYFSVVDMLNDTKASTSGEKNISNASVNSSLFNVPFKKRSLIEVALSNESTKKQQYNNSSNLDKISETIVESPNVFSGFGSGQNNLAGNIETQVSKKNSDEADPDEEIIIILKRPIRNRGRGTRRPRVRGRGRIGNAVEKNKFVQKSRGIQRKKRTGIGAKRTHITSSGGNDAIDPSKYLEGVTRSSQRISGRIALLRIKEAERRQKEEESALYQFKNQHSRKIKVNDKKTININTFEDNDDSENSFDKKRRKKRKSNQGRKKNNKRYSSESESDGDEEGVVDETEEDQNQQLEYLFKSDHEFSCESDVSESDITPIKHARTATKETDISNLQGKKENALSCEKCHTSDHPEWILLCDECNSGWHTSCLRPSLLVIPEGDWYCPNCNHNRLLLNLEKQMIQFVNINKKKESERKRKERLAFVSLSLSNLMPSKNSPISSGSSSETAGLDDCKNVSFRKRNAARNISYNMKKYDAMIKDAVEDGKIFNSGASYINADGKEVYSDDDVEEIEDEDSEENINVPHSGKNISNLMGSQGAPNNKKNNNVKIGLKKRRKISSLSSDDDEDAEDDSGGSDFKLSEVDDDDDDDFINDSDTDFNEYEYAKKKGNTEKAPTRKSNRDRRVLYDDNFIFDGSEDDESSYSDKDNKFKKKYAKAAVVSSSTESESDNFTKFSKFERKAQLKRKIILKTNQVGRSTRRQNMCTSYYMDSDSDDISEGDNKKTLIKRRRTNNDSEDEYIEEDDDDDETDDSDDEDESGTKSGVDGDN